MGQVGSEGFWQGHKGKPLVCLCSVSYSDYSLTFMITFQVSCHELEYLQLVQLILVLDLAPQL